MSRLLRLDRWPGLVTGPAAGGSLALRNIFGGYRRSPQIHRLVSLFLALFILQGDDRHTAGPYRAGSKATSQAEIQGRLDLRPALGMPPARVARDRLLKIVENCSTTRILGSLLHRLVVPLERHFAPTERRR